MSNSTTVDPPAVSPEEQTRQRTRPRRQPPYAVILHNDPINGFDYVVRVLKKVFKYSNTKAVWLTLQAHCTGRSCIWSGALEVAELKADQVRSCGPDPAQVTAGATRLTVTVEALPSD